jgi:SAM-dependent methyltransferase
MTPDPDDTPPAVRAFGDVAGRFDERFGSWLSVAAQRRAVRRELLRAFRPETSLLELGGGTGLDAVYLGERGRRVLVTDGAPAMVEQAAARIVRAGVGDRVAARRVVLERLDRFADELAAERGSPAAARFDGAYSNFAALNCVHDLGPVARGLARLLRPGAKALLVVFGPFAPGEVLVQLLRGDPRAGLRRLERRGVAARLAGHAFTVDYPTPQDYARAFSPALRLVRTVGIGVFVPPSAAEPWVSRWPRLLDALERLDRLVGEPLAWLGDHVLLELERTSEPERGA